MGNIISANNEVKVADISEIDKPDRLGTWHAIDEMNSDAHGRLYLLENKTFGNSTAARIVNEAGDVIVDDVWNGWLAYGEFLCQQAEETAALGT